MSICARVQSISNMHNESMAMRFCTVDGTTKQSYEQTGFELTASPKAAEPEPASPSFPNEEFRMGKEDDETKRPEPSSR